jgi:hypothetical protein
MLALALTLGVRKEIGDWRKDNKDSGEKKEATRQHLAEISKADQANQGLQKQLDSANEQLGKLKSSYDAQRLKLDSANSTLTNVRSDLAQTRTDLSQQSVASAVNALAASNQKITALAVMVPLTAHARVPSGIIDVFVPRMPLTVCQELTGVEISIRTSNNDAQRIFHSSRDKEPYYDHPVPAPQKVATAL